MILWSDVFFYNENKRKIIFLKVEKLVLFFFLGFIGKYFFFVVISLGFGVEEINKVNIFFKNSFRV